MLSEEEQLKKIDRATDKALHEIEKERKDQPRDYIAEWFKWVEKVGKYLRKHILHQKGNMDINKIEQDILDNKRMKKPILTMFGVNLGVELNQRLSRYAKTNSVSKASVIKTLLINYLDEKEVK